MLQTLSDINATDFENDDDLLGFGFFLTSLLRGNGFIIFSKPPTKQQEQIEYLAYHWLKAVENRIMSIKHSHRLPVLEIYDIFYRFVHRKAPNENLLNEHRLIVINAFINGDKSIKAHYVMPLISLMTRFPKAKGFHDEQKKYYENTLKEWYDEFTMTGNFLSGSVEDAITRASVLIRESLKRFTDDEIKVKNNITQRISLLFNYIPTYNTCTLKALLLFLYHTKCLFIADKIADKYIKTILERLVILPEVNRYERQAYMYDLNNIESTNISL